VHFDAANAPANTSGWRIGLAPAQNEVTLGVAAVEIGKDGSFTVPGIPAGRYRIEATAGSASSAWWARSAAIDERNLLDVPFDIRSDVHDLVVTYTDKVAELSGTLHDAAAAAADYFVLVFPTDKSLWGRQPRRVQMARPASDGKYVIRNLPAGDYLLVATTDVEPLEWRDPAFLRRMAPAGIAITLADGEQKVQDLKVAK
jgi:hypothetical protein